MASLNEKGKRKWMCKTGKQDLLDFDFVVPEFFDKDKFKINIELISNKLTKDYIKESDKLEYIFI